MSNYKFQTLVRLFNEIISYEKGQQNFIVMDDCRYRVVLKEMLHYIVDRDLATLCTDLSLVYHLMASMQECLTQVGGMEDYSDDVEFPRLLDSVLEHACDNDTIHGEDFSFIPGLDGLMMPRWDGIPFKLTNVILNLLAIQNHINLNKPKFDYLSKEASFVLADDDDESSPSCDSISEGSVYTDN